MFSSLSKINNNDIKISRHKLVHDNLKYVNLYSRRCYELYDLGYISTPSLFIEEDFLGALYEEFPNEIKLLTAGINKKIIKEYDFFNYVIAISDNQDFNELLEKYRDILYCVNAFDTFTNLITKAHIRKKFDFTIVHSRLSNTVGCIRNVNVIPLDSDCIRNLIYIEDGYKVVSFNLGDIWLKGLADVIGIPEEEFNLCREENKSLFSDKLTFEDDCKYVKYLISGDVITRNKNTDILFKYLNNFYLTNYMHTTPITVVFKNIEQELSDKMDYYKNNSDVELLDFYVTNFDIYFKTPLQESDFIFNNEAGFEVGSLKNNGKIPNGIFVFDTFNEMMLDSSNTLEGVSGEFIGEQHVNTSLYDVVGLPVEIKFFTKRGTPLVKTYYPIFNLRAKGATTIYPYFGFKSELVL